MAGEIQLNSVTLATESGGTISLSSDVDAESSIKSTLNASGSAPIYACRAWVNFNGTGTVSIRASGNVSSITDNGTGWYTVNFTTAMPDANYCMSGAVTVNGNISSVNFYNTSSTSSAAIIGVITSISYSDHQIITVTFFR